MLKTVYVFLLSALLAVPVCGRRGDAPPLAATCSALPIASAETKQSICGFYDTYARVLNDKKTEALLPYIGEAYKGSDGMNAQQIRGAIRQQMSQFPWRDAQFKSFALTENNGAMTIRHKMDVSIPEGRQIAVGETITWARSAQGNWRIINWLHKE